MEISTLISMLVIMSIVMGGFVFFLLKAIKKEKEKEN
jgi:preprotein translocase subunit YajC